MRWEYCRCVAYSRHAEGDAQEKSCARTECLDTFSLGMLRGAKLTRTRFGKRQKRLSSVYISGDVINRLFTGTERAEIEPE